MSGRPVGFSPVFLKIQCGVLEFPTVLVKNEAGFVDSNVFFQIPKWLGALVGMFHLLVVAESFAIPRFWIASFVNLPGVWLEERLT